MGVISYSETRHWFSARWSFCTFLEDVQRRCMHEPLLCEELEKAMAIDGLLLDHIDAGTRELLAKLLVRTARDTIANRHDLAACWRGGVSLGDQPVYLAALERFLLIAVADDSEHSSELPH